MRRRKPLQHYEVRWLAPDTSRLGNVTFTASNDAVAIRKAERISREVRLVRCRRMVFADNRTVQDIVPAYA